MNISTNIEKIFNSQGYEFNDAVFNEIDSLDFINIIIAIEDTFSVEIPDEYLSFDFMRSDSLIDVITELRDKKHL